MNSLSREHGADHLDPLFTYALHALPPGEVAVVESQISACEDCRKELETLRAIVVSFVSWPTDVLRPPAPLWDRIAQRIATDAGGPPPAAPPQSSAKPEWEQAAPGIFVKILASDPQRHYASILVRLAPGTDYPAHRHAAIEELHLLDGELIVDDRKLYPGDFIHAKPGTMDHRVWSETGCTCVLMTSTDDALL